MVEFTSEVREACIDGFLATVENDYMRRMIRAASSERDAIHFCMVQHRNSGSPVLLERGGSLYLTGLGGKASKGLHVYVDHWWDKPPLAVIPWIEVVRPLRTATQQLPLL